MHGEGVLSPVSSAKSSGDARLDGPTDHFEVAHGTPTHNRLLAAYLDRLGAPSSLDTTVHRSDEMFASAMSECQSSWNDALVLYHRCGAWAWRMAQQLLDRSRCEHQSWLDFGCGYGRMLRFGVANNPDLAITGCEIDPAAVAFVERQFGVTGLQSSHRPEQFAGEGGHSLVTVQSVFTHLPQASFEAWLKRLWQEVAPGGVLCLSTHNLDHKPEQVDDGQTETGFVFERHSESEHLDHEVYGTTWVSDAWIRAAIGRAAGSALDSIEFVPQGLWDAQDLWVVSKAGKGEATELAQQQSTRLLRLPVGYLDRIELLDNRTVTVSGWGVAELDATKDIQPKTTIEALSLPEIVSHPVSHTPLASAEVEHPTTISRTDLRSRYGEDYTGGDWAVTLELPEPFNGLEVLCLSIDGWPAHFSLLDKADQRLRTAMQIYDLEVEQRMLKAVLERKGGLPLRFARAALRRLRPR